MHTNCLFALLLCASVGAAVELPLARSADTHAPHLVQQFAAGQMKLQSFIIESENTSGLGTNRSLQLYRWQGGRLKPEPGSTPDRN